MEKKHSVDELLEFLTRASERGLMPAATAKALAVASRAVFEILSAEERADVRRLDLAGVIKRFGNKRAKDFNPASLKEYSRRVQRAVQLFRQWSDDPAGFSVSTRSTGAERRKSRAAVTSASPDRALALENAGPIASTIGNVSGYQSSFPVRPGTVVTISNIPVDLSQSEAERLAQFVKMLVVE